MEIQVQLTITTCDDYNSAGTYDVSLTINYNEETQVSSDDLSSLDLASATSYDSTITQIIVQGTQAELNNYGSIKYNFSSN